MGLTIPIQIICSLKIGIKKSVTINNWHFERICLQSSTDQLLASQSPGRTISYTSFQFLTFLRGVDVLFLRRTGSSSSDVSSSGSLSSNESSSGTLTRRRAVFLLFRTGKSSSESDEEFSSRSSRCLPEIFQNCNDILIHGTREIRFYAIEWSIFTNSGWGNTYFHQFMIKLDIFHLTLWIYVNQ